MRSLDNFIDEAAKPLSRKRFMAAAGAGLAATVAGAVLPACESDKGGHAGSEPLAARPVPPAASPPATVPDDAQKPIELEPIHSKSDRETGLTPTPLPPTARVGFALVGLGHLTLNQLLPALAKSGKARAMALVSGSREKMARVAAQYGIDPKNCFTYEEYERLKDVKECQAVYIVLPNALHKEYVLRAAKIGKHVLCEKPMAVSAAEGREMVEACRAAKVKLMIAYRIQYQPHNRYVRAQVQKGALGTVKFYEAFNGQAAANPAHWRFKKALAGGGALPDIGLYCLNTIRFLLGEEPVEIMGAYQYATPGNPLFAEVEELMSWQMRFPSGAVAVCSTDYNTHESRRYRLLGEKGWINLEAAFAYEGQRLQTSRAEGPVVHRDEVDIAAKDQFMLEMDHFADCIRHGREPFTPGEEGVQDQIIMEAIYEAARTGRPVKLKEVGKKDAFRGPEPEGEAYEKA